LNIGTLFDLNGKTAVVTGGGGILGRGFCSVLALHGARVAVVDINEEAAEASRSAVKKECGEADVIAITCDVSDPDSVNAMVSKVVGEFGGIDILLNNAASKSSDLEAFYAAFEDYSLDQWREVMSVNLDGVFLVVQAVGRQMLKQGRGGSIIQTASVYGIVAPDQSIYEGSRFLDHEINTPAVYSASKAAVIGLTRHLAAYWGGSGIRVNALSPGGVESGQNDTFVRRYSEKVPLGRMAGINEMQAAFLFLASDESSYMTGQNIIIDGGLTCW
jgi:NAD(P)-dependent dehydrogenase (short-subunit alcohol dehydrogenase family)